MKRSEVTASLILSRLQQICDCKGHADDYLECAHYATELARYFTVYEFSENGTDREDKIFGLLTKFLCQSPKSITYVFLKSLRNKYIVDEDDNVLLRRPENNEQFTINFHCLTKTKYMKEMEKSEDGFIRRLTCDRALFNAVRDADK